jgi:putative oxidoreductase
LIKNTGMKNSLFSSGKHKGITNFALLIHRLAFGSMLLTHGIPKLMHFSELSPKFTDPIGLGSEIALGLTIFSEVFCSILVMLGLGTRLAAFVVITEMVIAVFRVHIHAPFATMELALIYMAAFVLVLLAGAGSVSMDKLISKK